jgi:hypothetical protein
MQAGTSLGQAGQQKDHRLIRIEKTTAVDVYWKKEL